MQFISRVLLFSVVICNTSATSYAKDKEYDPSNSELKNQNDPINDKGSNSSDKNNKEDENKTPQYKKAKKEKDKN